MSSVGSSDSSNPVRAQEEALRKARESAQNNESDLVKKHQREVRRINEEHYAEIENLKKAHMSQMNDLRKSTGSDVNERDHKYQQEIDDVRALYRKQLQDQADSSNRRDEALRKATTGDLDQQKTQTGQRIEQLTDDYQKNRLEQEKGFGEALNETRDVQHQAIDKVRDRLGRQYEEQAKSIKDERNMRVGGLQKGFDDYRQSAEARNRDQELRHFQDQQRSSENLLRAVNRERVGQQDNEEYLREGFRDGIDRQRNRYEKAMAKEREIASFSRDDMRSTVGNRIDNQVTRLERENYDLKEGNVQEGLKARRQVQREVSNIQDAYSKNMDNYKEQRDEAVRRANDGNHKDIQKVRKELETQATETNRFYRQQQDEQNRISRTAYDNLVGDFEVRNEATKSTADKRVKDLFELTNDEKARMSELQVENHTASQHSHQDEMKQLRSELEADKQIAVNNLQMHIQKQEISHGERMTQVVGKYEKEILTLKDQLAREQKINSENLKRTTEEMQHQHKLSLDQVATQTRERMRQQEAHHSEELRTINKRNDEKLDQVINEVKRT